MIASFRIRSCSRPPPVTMSSLLSARSYRRLRQLAQRPPTLALLLLGRSATHRRDLSRSERARQGLPVALVFRHQHLSPACCIGLNKARDTCPDSEAGRGDLEAPSLLLASSATVRRRANPAAKRHSVRVRVIASSPTRSRASERREEQMRSLRAVASTAPPPQDGCPLAWKAEAPSLRCEALGTSEVERLRVVLTARWTV
jgi:hypothetical protein